MPLHDGNVGPTEQGVKLLPENLLQLLFNHLAELLLEDGEGGVVHQGQLAVADVDVEAWYFSSSQGI